MSFIPLDRYERLDGSKLASSGTSPSSVCMWLVTDFSNPKRSSSSTTQPSPTAETVAVRGASLSSACSPKYCPRPRRTSSRSPFESSIVTAHSPSNRRDCQFADALSPSLLTHLLKVERGAAE